MKYKFSLFLIIFIIVIGIYPIFSQSISSTINGVYRIDNQSSGYSIFIDYTFNLKNRVGLKIGLGHTMTVSQRPQGMDGYMIGGIRDYNNLNPYEANFFFWTDKQFPGINLPTRDNKYFKLDLLVAVDNALDKGNFSINPGIVISYNDVQKIVRYIKAEKIDNFIGPTVYNQLIPVYNYATYIDMGAVVQLQYDLWSYNRLDIGLNSMIMYYPISSQVSVQLGAVFEINMDK